MAKINLTNGSSASTPASGIVSVYSKADKNLYLKDDTGLETLLSVVGYFPVISASLTDNTATQTITSFAAASIGAIFVEYQFRESTTLKFKSGYFIAQFDGAGAFEYSDTITVMISDPGITLSIIWDGFANYRLNAATTSTGHARIGKLVARTLAAL